MEKTQLHQRIDALDYLRGFALLGIIFMNILFLLSLDIPANESIDASYQRFLYLFVEGRFYTIFSFLFGYGFYIFISRAQHRGDDECLLYIRRIVFLFCIGIIHQMFQTGEALLIYAVCGLLIIPHYKLNKRTNLIIALLGMIMFGYFGHLLYLHKVMLTFPLILLGMVAGQYRVFEQLAGKVKNLAMFTVIMFILSALGLLYQYLQAPDVPFWPGFSGGLDPIGMQTNKFLFTGIILGPIVSACFIGIILLLIQIKPVRILLTPLKYYGRMALTNYIGQTALILLANHYFDFSALTYIQTFYICAYIHLILIAFSTVWLSCFQYGPLEWLWRTVTYLKFPPLLVKSK